MSRTLSPEAARALRNHLLLSLGLGLTGASGCSGFGGTCDERPPRVVTVSLDALAEDTGVDTGADSGTTADPDVCPPSGDAALDLLLTSDEIFCGAQNPQLLEQSGRDCTYEYTCFTCCGYGRPYLDGTGTPVEAEAIPVAGWADGPDRPDVTELTAAERAEIGRYWRENARAEHSSVAGFHRFALDLLAHGAPPGLIARAQRAAAQELRHALDCFTLASAYLGEPIGPAPMQMGGQAPIAANLAQLAAWTARDGALGETLAAWLAERALAGATDPAVRAVLERIVRDETEHAELAWATVRWAIEAGGDEVREAVAAVFARLGDPQPHPLEWTERLAAHGVPSPEQERADATVCVTSVILPVAQALLAAGRLAA
ncbi:MAG: ferritin-like domain-containing protein [Pseudomonadota bacterium]|nr:ferritin-like domain-containing protein [Pseudomonadota bacterium]